jgi:hypothetical protein
VDAQGFLDLVTKSAEAGKHLSPPPPTASKGPSVVWDFPAVGFHLVVELVPVQGSTESRAQWHIGNRNTVCEPEQGAHYKGVDFPGRGYGSTRGVAARIAAFLHQLQAREANARAGRKPPAP